MSETSSVRMADNKSAKKRKAKPASATPPPAETSAEAKVNGHTESDGDSPYLKELQKYVARIS